MNSKLIFQTLTNHLPAIKLVVLGLRSEANAEQQCGIVRKSSIHTIDTTFFVPVVEFLVGISG